jgi:hypothetical protein
MLPLRLAERTKAGRLSHEPPRITCLAQFGSVHGRPSRGSTHVVRMPAVRCPLPGIAQHPKESEGVWPEAADLREEAIIPGAAATVAIGHVVPDRIAPPTGGSGPAACGIVPLGFARQTVRTSPSLQSRALLMHPRVQPRDVGLSIAPIEADGGPLWRLLPTPRRSRHPFAG